MYMTVRDIYEYAKSIGAEDCYFTFTYTEYDENDGTVCDINYCPCCPDEFAHYNNEFILDVR